MTFQLIWGRMSSHEYKHIKNLTKSWLFPFMSIKLSEFGLMSSTDLVKTVLLKV